MCLSSSSRGKLVVLVDGVFSISTRFIPSIFAVFSCSAIYTTAASHSRKIRSRNKQNFLRNISDRFLNMKFLGSVCQHNNHITSLDCANWSPALDTPLMLFSSFSLSSTVFPCSKLENAVMISPDGCACAW